MPWAWRSPRPSSRPSSARISSITTPGACAGDGCLMEGISQEAISLAGHLNLNKLTLIWDNNGITIDGKVSNADSTDQLKRFEASGWNTVSIDGHDQAAVEKALIDARKKSTRPLLIAAKTTIGFGAPKKQGTEKVHGSPLGAEELAAAKAALGITYPAFEIPKDTLDAWRAAGTRSANAFGDWQGRFLAARRRQARRVCTAHQGRSAGGLERDARRLQAEARGGQAEGGDAQVEPDGARCDQRDSARDRRRLGRPHRLEPHQHQGDAALHRYGPARAATCATASASMACRRS